MRHHNYYVYILSSLSKTLYIGMTSDLIRRLYEHQEGAIEGFSKRYHCHSLVYYEHYTNIKDCIAREKQLKNWNRAKKEWLIQQMNPNWRNLSKEIS